VKCQLCGEREAIQDAAFCDPCLEVYEEATQARSPMVARIARYAVRYSRCIADNPRNARRIRETTRRYCTTTGAIVPAWARERYAVPIQAEKIA
jgi:hypothetical protein